MTMIAKAPERPAAPAIFAALLPLAVLAGCGQPAGQTSEEEAAAADPAPTASATPPTAPPPEQASAPGDIESQIPANFRALGTEPFWAVTTGGPGTAAGLRYSTPENIEGTEVTIEDERVQPAMRRLTGTMNGKDFSIELTVGQCSDGMSDRVYPFTARIVLDGESLSGCGRPMDG